MKEATRQLVLLIGVMSILAGGLVTINAARSDSTSSDTQDVEPASTIQNQTNEAENTTINTGNTVREPSKEVKSNSSSIVVQSVNGWQALWRDMKTGWQAILSSSNSSS